MNINFEISLFAKMVLNGIIKENKKFFNKKSNE